MDDDWRFDLEQWPGPTSDPVASLKDMTGVISKSFDALAEAMKKGIVHITLHTSDPMKKG